MNNLKVKLRLQSIHNSTPKIKSLGINSTKVQSSGKESAFQCRRCRRQFWSMGQKDPLEWEMATHSSILAWEILWTEESGRLQSMGHKESGMIKHMHTCFLHYNNGMEKVTKLCWGKINGDTPHLWIRKLLIIKIAILPTLLYRFNITLWKFLQVFL